MTPVNFNGLTTDELLKLLPPADENLEWELKGANFLEPKQRSKELPKLLGKQISAFANSGGGYLVIGIENDTRTIQPCNESDEGNRKLIEWLPDVIYTCVDYPISSTEVHRIAVTGDDSKAIYVVEIPKSEAAPHMSKGDGKYYYRAGRSSTPAPHWYLELLHNQKNKASVAIKKVVVKDHTAGNTDSMRPTIKIEVTLENTSFVFADHACVMVKSNNPAWRQTASSISPFPITHGYLWPADKPLFPTGSYEMHGYFESTLEMSFIPTLESVRAYLSEARFAVRPISNDFVGPERVVHPLDDSEFVFALAPLVQTLRNIRQRVIR